MTRKRFVKKLMAIGVSRRTAAHSAEAARATGKSYDLVFRALMYWIYGQLIAEIADFIAGRPRTEARVDG